MARSHKTPLSDHLWRRKRLWRCRSRCVSVVNYLGLKHATVACGFIQKVVIQFSLSSNLQYPSGMNSSAVYRGTMIIDFEYTFAIEVHGITSRFDHLTFRLMTLHRASLVEPAYCRRKLGVDTESKPLGGSRGNPTS